MPLFQPGQGTHIVHEEGVEDRSYTLADQILHWTDGEFYEWDETRNCFVHTDPGPPEAFSYVYFLEPDKWGSFIPSDLDFRHGTFDA